MTLTLTPPIVLTADIKTEFETICIELCNVLGSAIPAEELLNTPEIRAKLITKYCASPLTKDEKTYFKGNEEYNTTRRNDKFLDDLITDYKAQKIQEIADTIV